jgi:NAD(P)-dependent dehydrogenase (short-subunit alcohol dehydrogenase family)
MNLSGKVALVTGAAQGIGLAIVQRLVSGGASVALVDVNADALDDALSRLGGEGANITALVADLTDEAQARTVPDRAAARFGGVDILVNNAGVRTVSALVDHPIDDWRRALEVNLTAPFVLTQAVVPHLIARGGIGKIINITSVASTLGFKNRVAYNVSKAGLTMLTKSIALELGAQGIRCNAVAPGIIETPLNRDYFADPDLTSVIVDATPTRTWGEPQDIASAVAFLASDEANFINGATLLVDGGWSAGKGY